MQSIQVSQLTIIFIHKMVIDTCPLADSLGNGDIVLLSHYSNEICELEIGTYPFDSGIRFFSCEEGEEVIGSGVRSNPFGTEEILIEGCDALGSSCEPTIGEGSGGYTRCSAFGFGLVKWCGRNSWRIMLTESDSKRIVTGREIRGKKFAQLGVC